MQIDTRPGTCDDIRALVPEHAPKLGAARGLIHTLDPRGVEISSPGERGVWWSVAGEKMKYSCAYAMPHARQVNTGFSRGVVLPDPGNLLKGTDKPLHHIKLVGPDDVVRPAIADLLRAAIAERRDDAQAN